MATLLLTVEACYQTDRGLVVLPCLPLQALTSRPEFRQLQQGSRIELRRPDGTRRESRIATYGAPVEKRSDASLYVRGGPAGPEFEIRFTLAPELSAEEVPAGTEIWYLYDGCRPSNG
jgi:hypothetical protein